MGQEPLDREFLDSLDVAFNDHDVDAIDDRFAPDGIWFLACGPDHFGTRRGGHDEILSFLLRGLPASLT